jgi:hypothetical protein
VNPTYRVKDYCVSQLEESDQLNLAEEAGPTGMGSSCVYQPFQVSLVFLTVLSASTGDLAPNFACKFDDTI